MSLLQGRQLIEARRYAEQLAAKHFLQQRRGHRENADTRGHVQTQHGPHLPELRCLPSHIQMHLFVGDQRFLRGLARIPTGRAPAGGGQAIAECPADHEDEVADRESQQRLRHTDGCGRGVVLHQLLRQRRPDHCAAAKAHDRQSRGDTAVIREPLDQGRDGRDVAQTEPDAADRACSQPQHPLLMEADAEAGKT